MTDVPRDGEHFVSLLHEYLPLFEVWVRNVVTKQSAGVGASAKVYDIPITHVLDSFLKRTTSDGRDAQKSRWGGAEQRRG